MEEALRLARPNGDVVRPPPRLRETLELLCGDSRPPRWGLLRRWRALWRRVSKGEVGCLTGCEGSNISAVVRRAQWEKNETPADVRGLELSITLVPDAAHALPWSSLGQPETQSGIEVPVNERPMGIFMTCHSPDASNIADYDSVRARQACAELGNAVDLGIRLDPSLPWALVDRRLAMGFFEEGLVEGLALQLPDEGAACCSEMALSPLLLSRAIVSASPSSLDESRSRTRTRFSVTSISPLFGDERVKLWKGLRNISIRRRSRRSRKELEGWCGRTSLSAAPGGLHREISVNISASSCRGETNPSSSEEALLIFHLPRGLYVDVDELKSRKRAGSLGRSEDEGLPLGAILDIITYRDEPIDVELPSFVSRQQAVGVLIRSGSGADPQGAVLVDVSLPFHLRYPRPGNALYAEVSLAPPRVFIGGVEVHNSVFPSPISLRVPSGISSDAVIVGWCTLVVVLTGLMALFVSMFRRSGTAMRLSPSAAPRTSSAATAPRRSHGRRKRVE
jgi:hypothetical protein